MVHKSKVVADGETIKSFHMPCPFSPQGTSVREEGLIIPFKRCGKLDCGKVAD